MKDRADKVIVNRGLADDQHKAQALIMEGLIFSEGKRIEKPGQKISTNQNISIKEKMPYVGRGGLKLEEALDTFKISVRGKVAADLGASTGGFTDCLLQRNVKKVYAVDVNTKQIDWNIRNNSRVILLNKNARYLSKVDFQENLDLTTMDVSFISVLKIFPAIKTFLGHGILLSLIKPQFEAKQNQVGEKGIIRNPEMHEAVLNKLIREAVTMGFKLKGLRKLSLRGQKGNQEFFAYYSLKEGYSEIKKIQTLIKETVWNEKN
ncbi:MAG: TlyA family RNA methyltransferase [Candidatus Aminicenantaceae bacterium]